MCIICVKFNQSKDLFETLDMLNAAYREPNSIDAKHLTLISKALSEINHANLADATLSVE